MRRLAHLWSWHSTHRYIPSGLAWSQIEGHAKSVSWRKRHVASAISFKWSAASVRDTGCGMWLPTKSRRIFWLFSLVNCASACTSTRKLSGTGFRKDPNYETNGAPEEAREHGLCFASSIFSPINSKANKVRKKGDISIFLPSPETWERMRDTRKVRHQLHEEEKRKSVGVGMWKPSFQDQYKLWTRY